MSEGSSMTQKILTMLGIGTFVYFPTIINVFGVLVVLRLNDYTPSTRP